MLGMLNLQAALGRPAGSWRRICGLWWIHGRSAYLSACSAAKVARAPCSSQSTLQPLGFAASRSRHANFFSTSTHQEPPSLAKQQYHQQQQQKQRIADSYTTSPEGQHAHQQHSPCNNDVQHMQHTAVLREAHLACKQLASLQGSDTITCNRAVGMLSKVSAQELGVSADPKALPGALIRVGSVLQHLPGEEAQPIAHGHGSLQQSKGIPATAAARENIIISSKDGSTSGVQHPSCSTGPTPALIPPELPPIWRSKERQSAAWSEPHTHLVSFLSTAVASATLQGRVPGSQLAQLLLKLPMPSGSPCLPVLGAVQHLLLHRPDRLELEPVVALLRVLDEGGMGVVQHAAYALSALPMTNFEAGSARTQSLPDPADKTPVANTIRGREDGVSCTESTIPTVGQGVADTDGHADSPSTHTNRDGQVQLEGNPDAVNAPPPNLDPQAVLHALGDHLLTHLDTIMADTKHQHHVLLCLSRLSFLHTPLMHAMCKSLAAQLRAAGGTVHSMRSTHSRSSSRNSGSAHSLRHLGHVLHACSQLRFSHTGFLQATAAAVQQQWDSHWFVKGKKQPAGVASKVPGPPLDVLCDLTDSFSHLGYRDPQLIALFARTAAAWMDSVCVQEGPHQLLRLGYALAHAGAGDTGLAHSFNQAVNQVLDSSMQGASAGRGAQQHPKHNPGWLSRAAWTAAALHPQHAMPRLKIHPHTQSAHHCSGHPNAQADGAGGEQSGGGLRELMSRLVCALEGSRGRSRLSLRQATTLLHAHALLHQHSKDPRNPASSPEKSAPLPGQEWAAKRVGAATTGLQQSSAPSSTGSCYQPVVMSLGLERGLLGSMVQQDTQLQLRELRELVQRDGSGSPQSVRPIKYGYNIGSAGYSACACSSASIDVGGLSRGDDSKRSDNSRVRYGDTQSVGSAASSTFGSNNSRVHDGDTLSMGSATSSASGSNNSRVSDGDTQSVGNAASSASRRNNSRVSDDDSQSVGSAASSGSGSGGTQSMQFVGLLDPALWPKPIWALPLVADLSHALVVSDLAHAWPELTRLTARVASELTMCPSIHPQPSSPEQQHEQQQRLASHTLEQQQQQQQQRQAASVVEEQQSPNLPQYDPSSKSSIGSADSTDSMSTNTEPGRKTNAANSAIGSISISNSWSASSPRQQQSTQQSEAFLRTPPHPLPDSSLVTHSTVSHHVQPHPLLPGATSSSPLSVLAHPPLHGTCMSALLQLGLSFSAAKAHQEGSIPSPSHVPGLLQAHDVGLAEKACASGAHSRERSGERVRADQKPMKCLDSSTALHLAQGQAHAALSLFHIKQQQQRWRLDPYTHKQGQQSSLSIAPLSVFPHHPQDHNLLPSLHLPRGTPCHPLPLTPGLHAPLSSKTSNSPLVRPTLASVASSSLSAFVSSCYPLVSTPAVNTALSSSSNSSSSSSSSSSNNSSSSGSSFSVDSSGVRGRLSSKAGRGDTNSSRSSHDIERASAGSGAPPLTAPLSLLLGCCLHLGLPAHDKAAQALRRAAVLSGEASQATAHGQPVASALLAASVAQGVRDDSLVQLAQARLVHVVAHLLQHRADMPLAQSSQQRRSAQPGAGGGGGGAAAYAAELLLLGRCMAQFGPNMSSEVPQLLSLGLQAALPPYPSASDRQHLHGQPQQTARMVRQVAEGMQVLAELQQPRWAQAYADAATTWLAGLPAINTQGPHASSMPDWWSSALMARALQAADCHWPGLLMEKLLRVLDSSAGPSSARHAPTKEDHLQALAALLHMRTASAHARIPFYNQLVKGGTQEDHVLQGAGVQVLQRLTQHMRQPAAAVPESSGGARQGGGAGTEGWSEGGYGAEDGDNGSADTVKVPAAAATAADSALHSNGAAHAPSASDSMRPPSSSPSPPSQASAGAANTSWPAPELLPLSLPTLLPAFQSLATLLSPSLLHQATVTPHHRPPTTQLQPRTHASTHQQPRRSSQLSIFLQAGKNRTTSSPPPLTSHEQAPHTADPVSTHAHAPSTHHHLPARTLHSLVATTDQLFCLIQRMIIHGSEGAASEKQQEQRKQQQQGAIAVDALGPSPIHRMDHLAAVILYSANGVARSVYTAQAAGALADSDNALVVEELGLAMLDLIDLCTSMLHGYAQPGSQHTLQHGPRRSAAGGTTVSASGGGSSSNSTPTPSPTTLDTRLPADASTPPREVSQTSMDPPREVSQKVDASRPSREESQTSLDPPAVHLPDSSPVMAAAKTAAAVAAAETAAAETAAAAAAPVANGSQSSKDTKSVILTPQQQLHGTDHTQPHESSFVQSTAPTMPGAPPSASSRLSVDPGTASSPSSVPFTSEVIDLATPPSHSTRKTKRRRAAMRPPVSEAPYPHEEVLPPDSAAHSVASAHSLARAYVMLCSWMPFGDPDLSSSIFEARKALSRALIRACKHASAAHTATSSSLSVGAFGLGSTSSEGSSRGGGQQSVLQPEVQMDLLHAVQGIFAGPGRVPGHTQAVLDLIDPDLAARIPTVPILHHPHGGLCESPAWQHQQEQHYHPQQQLLQASQYGRHHHDHRQQQQQQQQQQSPSLQGQSHPAAHGAGNTASTAVSVHHSRDTQGVGSEGAFPAAAEEAEPADRQQSQVVRGVGLQGPESSDSSNARLWFAETAAQSESRSSSLTPPRVSPAILPSLPCKLPFQLHSRPQTESPSESAHEPSTLSHSNPALTRPLKPSSTDSQSGVPSSAVASSHALPEHTASRDVRHSVGVVQGVRLPQGGSHTQSSEGLEPPVLVGVAGLHSPTLPCLDVTSMFEAAGAFIKLGRDSAQTVQALLRFQYQQQQQQQQQQQLLQSVNPQQQQQQQQQQQGRWRRQQHPHLLHLDEPLWLHNQRQLQQRREILHQQQQELQQRKAQMRRTQQEKQQQRHQKLLEARQAKRQAHSLQPQQHQQHEKQEQHVQVPRQQHQRGAVDKSEPKQQAQPKQEQQEQVLQQHHQQDAVDKSEHEQALTSAPSAQSLPFSSAGLEHCSALTSTPSAQSLPSSAGFEHSLAFPSAHSSPSLPANSAPVQGAYALAWGATQLSASSPPLLAQSATMSGHTDALMLDPSGNQTLLNSLAGSANQQHLALDPHMREMARMGLVLSYERMVSWADSVLTALAFSRHKRAAQQGVSQPHRPPRFDPPLQGVTWYGIHTDSLPRQHKARALQQQQQQQQQRQHGKAPDLQGHGEPGQQQQQVHAYRQSPWLEALVAQQQQQQQQQQQSLTASLTLPASLEHHVLQSRMIQRVRGIKVMRVWRALYAMGWTDLAQADRVAQIMVAFRLRSTPSLLEAQHRRAARRAIISPWTKARGLPLQDAAESLVVFSDLAAAHQLQHMPPSTAILAFMRILLKQVVVDAHLIDPDTLQQVAHSVATAAQVFRDDPREQTLELQPGSFQEKEPHSRGNHHLLRGMLPLSKGAYLLQILAAAASYNTVLTPTPLVVGDEGMGAVRAVLERAAQACMQPGSSSLLRELPPAQGATMLLGLACGGVTDARTLLQRVLGMRIYEPGRLSLRVIANLAAACAASTEASQTSATDGGRASSSAISGDNNRDTNSGSSSDGEGGSGKDGSVHSSEPITPRAGDPRPEVGPHLFKQSTCKAPSHASQQGMRSPSFYYQRALKAAIAAGGAREWGSRKALQTQQGALADTLAAAAAAVGGRLPLTPREFLWLHKASEVVITRWSMAASIGPAVADSSPVYAAQLLRAYVQLGLANEQLLTAAEDLFTVTTRNMKPSERAAFVKVLGLLRQLLHGYGVTSRQDDEAVDAVMADDHC